VEIFVLYGILVGFIAGFFGVGGGTILVPLLLGLGYNIKEAVGITIIQMLFSSVYGSYVHYKEGRLDVKIVLFLALGGSIGAFLSAYFVQLVSNRFLELLFLTVIIFATIKLFYTPSSALKERTLSPLILFSLGLFVGIGAISIGVGGAIFIIPFLNAFLGYPLKKAVVASLFFVAFSSISAFVNWAIEGQLLYKEGLTIGLFSMLGVYVGIRLAGRVKVKNFKALMLLLNGTVLVYLIQKIVLV